MMLCANKVDNDNIVPARDGKLLAKKFGCPFIETSQVASRVGRYVKIRGYQSIQKDRL